MFRKVTLVALLSLSFGAACASAPEDEASESPSVDDLASNLTLLAEYTEGERAVAYYRSPGGGLVMRQDTPLGVDPLLAQEEVARSLPSVAFAKISGEEAPAELVQLEREIGIIPAEIQPRAASVPNRLAVVGTPGDNAYFTGNYCDSAAVWESVRNNKTPYESVMAQYYLPDLTADRTVTYEGSLSAIFGYSAVMNKAFSGAVTNKIWIDGGSFSEYGSVVQPRFVNLMIAWSNRRKSCGPFGLSCFYNWNYRKFQMGVRSIDNNEAASICGFVAG